MTYPTSIPFEPEAVLRQILNWRVKGFLSLRSPVVVMDEFGNETACWDANICEDSKELTAEPSIMDKVRTVKDLIEILETKPKCLMVWTSPPQEGFLVAANKVRTSSGKLFIESDYL